MRSNNGPAPSIGFGSRQFIMEMEFRRGLMDHRKVKALALRLKTLDTIGNCQRPVFSLGVSQDKHKITNL